MFLHSSWSLFWLETVDSNKPSGKHKATCDSIRFVNVTSSAIEQILWPLSWILSWITSSETIEIYAWFVMFVFGGTARHILRTLLPMLFSTTTFP